jgi:hypothetical protein
MVPVHAGVTTRWGLRVRAAPADAHQLGMQLPHTTTAVQHYLMLHGTFLAEARDGGWRWVVGCGIASAFGARSSIQWSVAVECDRDWA